MGCNYSSKFFMFAALITIVGAGNAHAFGGKANQSKPKKAPIIIIDQGNLLPTPTPKAACNFLVACEAGTHEDYNLCECVKDNNGCDPNVVKCAPDTIFNPKLCTCEPTHQCPPPPPCAAPDPSSGCVFAPLLDSAGCIISCGIKCPGDGGPLPPIRVND